MAPCSPKCTLEGKILPDWEPLPLRISSRFKLPLLQGISFKYQKSGAKISNAKSSKGRKIIYISEVDQMFQKKKKNDAHMSTWHILLSFSPYEVKCDSHTVIGQVWLVGPRMANPSVMKQQGLVKTVVNCRACSALSGDNHCSASHCHVGLWPNVPELLIWGKKATRT